MTYLIKYRKVIVFLTILVGLIFCTIVEARQWSEEMRLTHTQGAILTWPHFLTIDSNEDLLLVYNCHLYGEAQKRVAIFQKFSRTGEALTESIMISDISDMPDSFMQVQAVYLDQNDILHVFGSTTADREAPLSYFYTSLDNNGEFAGGGVRLGGVPFHTISNRSLLSG